VVLCCALCPYLGTCEEGRGVPQTHDGAVAARGDLRAAGGPRQRLHVVLVARDGAQGGQRRLPRLPRLALVVALVVVFVVACGSRCGSGWCGRSGSRSGGGGCLWED